MTVAELGRRMSSAEFVDWQRFEDVEPFGPLADGAAAALLLEARRDPKRRPVPFTAAEALRMFAHDPAPPLPQDEASVMTRDLAWAAQMKKIARPARRRRKPA